MKTVEVLGWTECLAHLRTAGVDPSLRRESVRRALGVIARTLAASSVALICPGDECSGWSLECVGDDERSSRRWLEERLIRNGSDVPVALSQSMSLDRSPVVLGVGTGYLALFGVNDACVAEAIPEEVLGAFRVLMEIERLEATHLGEGATVAEMDFARLRHDPSRLTAGDGLTEMLALARDVSGADFTYWGSVRDGMLDVEWNYGASDSGFGFELPLGEGIGGRAFARGEAFEVEDYLNCRYRYPGVSEATDSEKVRTALAIPLHGERDGAVLYAVRREVESFTEAQRAMLAQIRDAVLPLPGAWSSPGGLYLSGFDQVRLQRSELRRLILECDRFRDLEAWLERLIRGPVIVLDGDGHPYLPTNLSRLESLETDDRRRSFPLPNERASGGSLALWPADGLSPEGWPDLVDDALAAFGVVLDRVEQTRERLGRQRSQWLRSVCDGSTSDDVRRDGNRLGLPVQSGEVWAIAWNTGVAQPRLQALADDAILDLLGGSMIAVEDGVGVVLLREPSDLDPSAVRDELLRHVGPTPLWLAHGAAYESFDGLRGALDRATDAVGDLRRSDDGTFVTGVDGRNLDSLLGNPAISAELTAFSERMLSLLIEHDRDGKSDLTRTFCMTLALGGASEAAKELYVHPNTVRYRMGRAGEILSADLSRAEDRTAFTLAAFVWLRRTSQP